MLKAAAERGWLNEKDAVLEALLCLKRAGSGAWRPASTDLLAGPRPAGSAYLIICNLCWKGCWQGLHDAYARLRRGCAVLHLWPGCKGRQSRLVTVLFSFFLQT
jgi:hypothetical protein